MAVNTKSNIYIEIIAKGFEKIKKNVKEVTNEFKGFKQGAEVVDEQIKELTMDMNFFAKRLGDSNNHVKSFKRSIKIMSTKLKNAKADVINITKSIDKLKYSHQQGEISTTKFKKEISKLNTKLKTTKSSVSIYKGKVKQANIEMKNGSAIAKQYSNGINRIQGRMDVLNNRADQNIKKMDQFHAELLSVMFFGMAMSAALSGMTQRAKESSGALELWGDMLEDLFLPIMESILPEMENFTKKVEGMDEGTKKSIGAIVLITEAISKLVMSLGMAGLAWFGFTQMAQTYPKLAKKITKAIRFITTPLRILWKVSTWVFKRILLVLAGFSATAILILTLIFGFILLAWIKDWGNMRARFDDFVEGIKQIASGVGETLAGIFKIGLGLVKWLFTGETDLISEGWKNFVNGLKNIAEGTADAIWAPFAWIWDMIKDFIQYLKDIKTEVNNVGVGGTIYNRIGSKVGGAMDWLGGLVGYASGGIVTRPTAALIGESGPEAVIPLNKMGGMGTSVTINNPIVRNDMDINKIAEQVGRVLEDNRRRFR